MCEFDICVVGLGYIGLPTALLFAKSGKKVWGYDVSQRVLAQIKDGLADHGEPGLSKLLQEKIKDGTLMVGDRPKNAEAYVIAVPTPLSSDRTPYMGHVQQAMNTLMPYMTVGCSVVLESTSPVGSTERYICAPLREAGFDAGDDVYVAYSPERVLPGNLLHELVYNDRIIGGVNEASSEAVKHLYGSFVKGKMATTDAKTAEMCKLMENAYRDVNIAFANDMAKMCEDAHVNAWDVQALCNLHPRVNILSPGPGVGGHCIAVDPWFLVERFGSKAALISSARAINDNMPYHTAQRILEIVEPIEKQITVAILGVSYKPNVDDIRESPILEIAQLLQQKGIVVRMHDPHVTTDVVLEKDIDSCIEQADILVLGVDHDAYRAIDFQRIARKIRHKIILDTRNALSRTQMESLGFTYHLLGCR